VGEYTAIGVDADGMPHMSYYAAFQGDLRYAHLKLEPTPPFVFGWIFGDSGAGTGQVVSHTYDQPGTYDVTLGAANCLGFGIVTVTHPLTVTCETAEILSVTTAISGCQVAFAVEVDGTAPFTYRWDFGPFGSSLAPSPTVDFGQTDTYPYTLTVSNCGGNMQAVYAGTVEVTCIAHCDPAHQAAFIWSPLLPQAGEAVLFQGFVLGTPPFTYTWDLGDSSAATGMTTTHAYMAAGTYTVMLTVDNACGQAGEQHRVTVVAGQRWWIYLPLVVRE
jgi:PKD repeat protein